jgi:hypothetical protein
MSVLNQFNKFLHKHILRLKIGLVILVFIPALYLFLLEIGVPVPYIQLSNLHETIVLFGELLILLILYQRYFIEGWSVINFEYFLRDFLIVNSLFLLPFIKFYTNRRQVVIPLLRKIRPYLIQGYYALLVGTAYVSFITQRFIKRVRKRLASEIDAQMEREDKIKARGEDFFTDKYPRLANIPYLGTIFVKIFLNGWQHELVLILLAILGLMLRLWNLDALPPYTDETSHLITAKKIFEGLDLQQVTYRRSLYTVTIPLVLFFKVFGMSLWTARLVGVLANILSVIPLYLLSKRINKQVALIAVGIFALDPWMIAVSRNVREYAFIPLFYYFTALLMINFYESIPENLVFLRDFRRLLTWKTFLFIGTLGFILYFVEFIDPLSTFKMIFALYPVFGLLALRKLDWQHSSNIFLGSFLLLTGSIVAGIFLKMLGGQFITVNKKFNDFFISLFYDHPPQQWYYNRPLIAVILFVIAILATTLWEKRKFVLPFTMMTYSGTLLAFSYFRIKSNRPRYVISIQIWHILLMAVGLFLITIIIKKIIKFRNTWAVVLVLLLFCWNVPHTFIPTLHTSSGLHPITDEYHADMDPAYEFLSSHSDFDDVIVTTTYIDTYYQWKGEINFTKVVKYIYHAPEGRQVILDTIEAYPRGWIVLDYMRGFIYSKPVHLENFIYAGKKVNFLGWYGDVFLFRWGD